MQIFNKTSDLHNRLIQIGVISFNTPVLYVGLVMVNLHIINMIPQ